MFLYFLFLVFIFIYLCVKLLNRLDQQEVSDQTTLTAEVQNLDNEMLAVKQRILEAHTRRVHAQASRTKISSDLHTARQIRDALTERVNSLQHEHSLVREQHQSLCKESLAVTTKLNKYMQINVVNDAFYVWYVGPFGTINNLRLGTLPVRAIDWTEINAALGQAVMAVAVVAAKAKIEFTKYLLFPMGSFPRVLKIEDNKRTSSASLSLFTDGSFSLFPKRNFNAALTGFLSCVWELGEHTSNRDPTLTLPYAIHVSEGRVHDQSVMLGGEDEVWTRGLKFLLTDVKWLVAWAAKHCNNTTSFSSATSVSNGRFAVNS